MLDYLLNWCQVSEQDIFKAMGVTEEQIEKLSQFYDEVYDKLSEVDDYNDLHNKIYWYTKSWYV